MRIVLASASPRRREIMNMAGYDFEVIPAKGEEIITSAIPSEVVQSLALKKAREVARASEAAGARGAAGAADAAGESSTAQTVYIGADTVVAAGGKILGKPANTDDAYKMISMISGGEHHVFTGVAIICGDEEVVFYEDTAVHITELSDEEIREYVESGEPMDKAGGYAIQGIFGKYVTAIEGDFYNVVGLPIARLHRELKRFIRR